MNYLAAKQKGNYEQPYFRRADGAGRGSDPKNRRGHECRHGTGTMEIVYAAGKVAGLRCMKKYEETPESRARIESILGREWEQA